MHKWKLLIISLPIVIAVVAVKLIVLLVFKYEGILELSEMGLILTGGIFLMGFMLAGTMADYKESEKIPSELASFCENLEEGLTISTNEKVIDKLPEMKKITLQLFIAIDDWFKKKITYKQLCTKYDEFQPILWIMEKNTGPNYYLKVMTEFQNIRKIISRINVISVTGFIAAGYALLEILIVIISCLLMITKFKTVVAAFIIIFIIMLIYTYMYKLIKDIDDPFEYSDEKKEGTAEVDLTPFTEYLEKAKVRLVN
jgi:hypothetical protein